MGLFCSLFWQFLGLFRAWVSFCFVSFSAIPSKKSLAALAFLSLFVLFFLLRREMAEQAFRQEPPSASSVQVLPDTIKFNGDSLSFRGRTDGRLYQVFYKIKSASEKKAFQQLTDLVVLDFEGEFEHAQQQRNFSGFDYQAYLRVREFTVP